MDYQSQIINAVKTAAPAVVSITIAKEFRKLSGRSSRTRGYPLPDFFEEFFGIPAPEEIPRNLPKTKDGKIKIGGGSGFVVSKDGVILTNRHVIIDKEASYTVVYGDGKEYPAKIIARDPINDVAILKIAAKNLPTAKLGDSSKLELGSTVIAIGNALGEFQNTVSTGVVAGLSRHLYAQAEPQSPQSELRGLIQTDAAINPGNSGGPLVNLDGEVIGINCAIVWGAQNIGFAIPVNAAKRDLKDLEKYGKIRLPFLGIRYVMLTKEIQKANGLPIGEGAWIIRESLNSPAVVLGSPAQKAGVKENDIVVECDGEIIGDKNSVADVLQKRQVGDSIKLKLLRDGKEKSVKIKLEERK